MNMKRTEKGQAIIIVVVAFVGLIALSALVIDGGQAYLTRRQAQTAADAGALAGAHEYCVNGGDPTAIITQYVETENDAVLEGWEIADGQLVVTVNKTQQNFFAQIFNQPSTLVRADAAASCFTIGAAGGLLPIAWTCRPPAPGMDTLGGNDCAMWGIPHETFDLIIGSGFDFSEDILDYGDPDDHTTYYDDLDGTNGDSKVIFLVADSLKVAGMLEEVCYELNPALDPLLGNGVDCDFEDDGIIDIDGGAGRGWLLMDGDDNQGAAVLFSIIDGSLDVATDTPRWFAGLSGGKTSAFGVIRDLRVGDYALIPVFDAVCDTDDPMNDAINCPTYYGAGEPVVYANGTADYVYYRVNGFAVFYISCVSKVPGDKCPGKDRALSYDVIEHNTATVEGYFIEYYVPDDVTIGENSLDTGIYILSLTE
jgi:hypothetical protein